MTEDKAREFCKENGLSVVEPGSIPAGSKSARPYWLIYRPLEARPDHVAYTTGELLAEAVIVWRRGESARRVAEHRQVAPNECPCSGGEKL